jgi:hypothetical protein
MYLMNCDAWPPACGRQWGPRWSTTTPSAGPLNRGSAPPSICSSAWDYQQPASASQCAATGCCSSAPSPPAADTAGHGWRKSWAGSTAEVQHQHQPDPFAVPPGLHALRPNSKHAATQAFAADRAVQLSCSNRQRVRLNICLMETNGWVSPHLSNSRGLCRDSA